MAVKILHAADFHLDSPFSSLSEEKAAERRRESRELLMELASLCEEEKVQVVLLSGDLFDSGVSYRETQDMMVKMLGAISAEVFIAPGNHDYWSARSPYAYMELPENVHIFKSPQPRYFELPELNCRVWGAGFISPVGDDMLYGFKAEKSDMINLMALHASLGGDRYCPVTTDEIAASGLDYLALGHIHSYSGIQKAGTTYYAYPGCLEGRGFDECGEKGVIIGTVGKGSCALEFRPMAKRKYRELTVDLTGKPDAEAAVSEAVGAGSETDIVRIILTGEYSGEVDAEALLERFESRFYALRLKDRTVPAVDLWAGADDDSLRGLFLGLLKARYNETDDEKTREEILRAARYGVAALDGREAYRP